VNPVSINITLLFQFLSFLVVLYFINRWLAKPVGKIMSDRQDRIRAALAAADQAREEAASREQEQVAALQAAREEAQKVIVAAREAADQLRADQLAQAKIDANRLVAQARAAIGQEREQAKQELRTYVVDLTVLATRRVIGQTLDASGQHAFIGKMVDEVVAGNASGTDEASHVH
jgi:F-type H+-transporting ATPase subunit b